MELREKIKKVVNNYNLVRIATINQDGMPKVRSVDYAADKDDESVLYFMTFKTADKVDELLNNNNVHIVIDQEAHSFDELAKVLYIKASGKAYPVGNGEEIQKGMGLIMEKYPYLSNLPGDPSMMMLFRIELNKVILTDNSVRFGYMEEKTYR